MLVWGAGPCFHMFLRIRRPKDQDTKEQKSLSLTNDSFKLKLLIIPSKDMGLRELHSLPRDLRSRLNRKYENSHFFEAIINNLDIMVCQMVITLCLR